MLANGEEKLPVETIIVSATRDNSSLDNYTGNLGVIDHQQLQTVSHVHINEIMQRIPGTWISRGNGQEHLTAIRSPVFTGAGSCGAFFMAEDGIALRANGFCNANQLFEANTEQAERIEVIRGPGSALYGSNALHGIINTISKASPDQRDGSLALEGGPHGYQRIKLSYGNRFDEHGYRISYNAASDDGYKDSSGFDQQKLSLRHDYHQDQLSIASSFRATDLDQDTAGYINGKDAYKNDDLKKYNPDPDAYRQGESRHFSSRIAYQVDEDSRLVITPYLRDNNAEFMMHWVPWQPIEENGHQSAGLQSTFFHITGRDYRWTTGFDLEYTDAYLKETQYTDIGDTEKPVGPHYDYDVEATVAATFAQLYWDTSASTEVTAGLRFEHTNYDYENNLTNGSACDSNVVAADCRFSRPADTTESFSVWSPNLGLIRHLTDQQTIFANISQGYTAPQAADLFRLQEGNMSTELDPVKMNSLEIGTRHSANQLYYELTVYAMKKFDDIFLDNERRMVAEGESSHQGIELALDYQLTDNVDFSTFFTYAKHRYSDNFNFLNITAPVKNNDIDTAPRHFGSAQLGWNYLDGSRMELEWVHMGKYYTDPENLHSYDGHDLFNLRIRQQLSQNWHIAARIMNLQDVDYAERADYTRFGGDRYFVGEPRSVYLSIEGSI
jgi:outer membrane receptor protein involved in Fe transport